MKTFPFVTGIPHLAFTNISYHARAPVAVVDSFPSRKRSDPRNKF